jgi:hypothetical protein
MVALDAKPHSSKIKMLYFRMHGRGHFIYLHSTAFDDQPKDRIIFQNVIHLSIQVMDNVSL